MLGWEVLSLGRVARNDPQVVRGGDAGIRLRDLVGWAEAKAPGTGEGSRLHSKVVSSQRSSQSLK